jgi:hypothetical protein
MTFEVKKQQYAGPVEKKVNDNSKFIQSVCVSVGVVGQPYEGKFEEKVIVFVEFPATGIDANEIAALVSAEASSQALAQFPNT